jgi:hypothetical protein
MKTTYPAAQTSMLRAPGPRPPYQELAMTAANDANEGDVLVSSGICEVSATATALAARARP